MLAPPLLVRTLALSHDRAGRAALWTAVATGAAADLSLSASDWALLLAVCAGCALTVRMLTEQALALLAPAC